MRSYASRAAFIAAYAFARFPSSAALSAALFARSTPSRTLAATSSEVKPPPPPPPPAATASLAFLIAAASADSRSLTALTTVGSGASK